LDAPLNEVLKDKKAVITVHILSIFFAAKVNKINQVNSKMILCRTKTPLAPNPSYEPFFFLLFFQ
jgi:hypothetical protein